MTIPATECCVVASILDSPYARLGTNICSALAYAPDYWESPEASKLAGAIASVIKRGYVPTKPMVKAVLEEYKPWVDHPTFNERSSLPLALAEYEASRLLPHYHGKRLQQVIGKAYSDIMVHPERARDVAMALRLQLEEMLRHDH